MERKHKIFSMVVPAALVALAVVAPQAGATTFCVPAFGPACTNAEGRVAEADLEKAMGTNASDGVADEVVIAAGTVTENGAYEPPSGFKNPGSIEPAGSDPLTVVGAGTAATVITSSGSGNIYLLALGSSSTRQITLRDLTVRVPAGFPDGLGAAVQLWTGDKLEDVDVVSLNAGSDGITVSGGAGNKVLGGEVRGEAGGSVDDGLRVDGTNAQVEVAGTTLDGTSWGLIASEQGAEMVASGITQVGTRTYGAMASAGTITLRNSLIRTDDAFAFYSSGSSQDSLIDADHVTAVNSGGATNPAMVATKAFDGSGEARIQVSNSILRGFGSGYEVAGKAGPGIGEASISARYSNFKLTGTSNFGGLDIATGNIDADPGLNPDGSLSVGSPSIDVGDPAAGGLATDILGAPRPADGNSDCTSRRDQGAFEYQPLVLPKCLPPGGEDPEGEQPGGGQPGSGQPGGGQAGGGLIAQDRDAPQTSIVKGPGGNLAAGKATFKLGADEAARFECKLDRGKRRPCAATKTYKKLSPGRHTFKAWAIDAAGNADATPAKRSFHVPA